YEALGTFFRQTKHQPVGLQDWNVHNLPPHLKCSFQVIDDRGAIVGTSDDLQQLQRDLAGQNQTALAASLTDAAQARGVALPSAGQIPQPQQPTSKPAPKPAASPP